MNYKQIEKIELETGCKTIEFDQVDGLYVFFNPEIKHGITIAGISGDAFFDAGMAKRLPDMLTGYTSMKKFELKGKYGSTILNGEQAEALARDLVDIIETYLEKTA